MWNERKLEGEKAKVEADDGGKVKTATLSLEFSSGNGLDKPEQDFNNEISVSDLDLESRETVDYLHRTSGGGKSNDDEGSGKGLNENYATPVEQTNADPKLTNPCRAFLTLSDHRPLKWREIQRALHCLHRFFKSNKIVLEGSNGTKVPNKGIKSCIINKNFNFSVSEGISKMRKVSGSECKRKRKPIYPNGGWPKDLLNGFKSNIYTVRNEKLKDERKYKHKKFLRSFPKDKGKRRKRIKVRERKKFRYFGGKACGVSERKRSKVRWETRIRSKIERVRTKTEDEEKKLESAKKFKIFDGIFLGEKTNGSRTENFQVFDNEKETGVESKRVIVENRPEKSGSNVKKKVESKNLKSETWPHFIYHRVSSNFLHPESKTRNRHPSAYVAISVAASSDSGSKS